MADFEDRSLNGSVGIVPPLLGGLRRGLAREFCLAFTVPGLAFPVSLRASVTQRAWFGRYISNRLRRYVSIRLSIGRYVMRRDMESGFQCVTDCQDVTIASPSSDALNASGQDCAFSYFGHFLLPSVTTRAHAGARGNVSLCAAAKHLPLPPGVPLLALVPSRP